MTEEIPGCDVRAFFFSCTVFLGLPLFLLIGHVFHGHPMWTLVDRCVIVEEVFQLPQICFFFLFSPLLGFSPPENTVYFMYPCVFLVFT